MFQRLEDVGTELDAGADLGELRRLLELLAAVEAQLGDRLEGIKWLEPFGVEIRYPGDRPDTLPGDEARARELAHRVRDAALLVLSPYLAQA